MAAQYNVVSQLKREPWEDQAKCDPSMDYVFFPETSNARDTPAWAYSQAKAFCVDCPVKRECGEFALANPHITGFGVWGGLDPRQRQTLRARRKRRAERKVAA